MKIAKYISIAILVFSCNPTQDNKTLESEPLSNQTIVSELFTSAEKTFLPCDNNQIVFDSTFNEFSIKVVENCINNSFVIDTSINSESRKTISYYTDTRFDINLKVGDLINKYTFDKKKSLGHIYPKEALSKSVFGSVIFEKFDSQDTTFYFNVFFGYPQSDNGEMIRFALNNKQGAKFIDIVPEEE